MKNFLKRYFKKISKKIDPIVEYDNMLTDMELYNFPKFVLTNSGIERARIANSHLVKRSKKIIRIFTSSDQFFEDGSYGKFGEWLPNDNIDVAILLSDDNNKLLKLESRPDNVKIKRCSKKFLNSIHKEFKSINHFIVVDECAYRREYDTTNKTFVLCFNDPEKCKILINLFDGEFIQREGSFWTNLSLSNE